MSLGSNDHPFWASPSNLKLKPINCPSNERAGAVVVRKTLHRPGPIGRQSLSETETCVPWQQPTRTTLIDCRGSRKDDRDPFTPEQLKAIFDDNTFSDPSRPRNAAFWLPLLGLFTGARLNELCQLKADDVAEYDGVHCLIIRKVDPQDRLKSRAAHRTIPLHPELVRLGFLDHVEQVRKSGGGRLFPDVPLGEDGYYSSIFSKRFSRFLKKSNAKTEKTGFHSLRHNMTMALREGGVPADRIRELMGWTGQGMEETTYGSSLRARTLFEEICKGKYPVDLSHLFSNSGAPSGTTSEDGGDDPLS